MPRAYSVDLRERVMAAAATGRSIAEVAPNFSLSRDAVYDRMRRLSETGSLALGTGQTGRPLALSAEHETLLQ